MSPMRSRDGTVLSLLVAATLACQSSSSPNHDHDQDQGQDRAPSSPDEASVAVEGAAAPPDGTSPLSLPGITIDVPATYVDLDPAQHERMVRSAQRAVPPGSEGHTELVGRRAAGGVGQGLAYVQAQTLVGGFVPPQVTARDALEAELEALPDELRAGGLQVTHVARAERDGGLELCADATAARDDRAAFLGLCTLALVDEQERTAFLTASCMGERGTCRTILDGRRYDPPPSIPLDRTLTPTPQPGLPELRKDGLGWLRFGMSHEDFATACRDSGFRVDDIDWSTEDPAFETLVESGRISRCSGLDARIGPGNVLLLDATFDPAGALVVATARVDASLDVMRGALTLAYPDTYGEADHLVHYVDREAEGFEIIGIDTAPTRIPGAGIIVIIYSRAGMDAPAPELPAAP